MLTVPIIKPEKKSGVLDAWLHMRVQIPLDWTGKKLIMGTPTVKGFFANHPKTMGVDQSKKSKKEKKKEKAKKNFEVDIAGETYV